jgi:hypothetical protein
MRERNHSIKCEVELCELENDRGRNVPGVEVTCPKCGHTTRSFGTGEKSIKRCLVLMREECPLEEKNWYVIEDNRDQSPQYDSQAPHPADEPDSERFSEGIDESDIPF